MTVPRPPLNILQTCFSHSWGGLEIQALDETRRLRERGHNIQIACCTGSRLETEAQATDIPVLPFDVRGYFHPIIMMRLGNLIKHEKIDIIHCQLSKDIATLVPAMKLSGRRVPIVLSKRIGSYVMKKDILHRFTYANVSRVLAISSVINKNVLDTTPVLPDRVITLHHAVDTDIFSLARVNRNDVRRTFGFDNSTTVVGFVGRFSPGKGHEEFLEAAAILRIEYPHLQFLIVGEASHGEQEYERNIRAMSARLGLHDTVTFAGFRKDIPDVMAAFDIFAFPSHAEAFGAGLIEAMAMERPVVSTNCDGVLDIVVNGETGLYVSPGDARELADAIARLIKDPVLSERIGKAGRMRVEKLFNQRAQIQKIENVYYELIGMTADGMSGKSRRTSLSGAAGF